MSADFDPYHRWLGIPRHQQPANHYRLLGIELYEADPSVIDDAASRQMAHVRTYARGEHVALSQRILNELAAARICLLNPQKKVAYDCTLRGSLLDSPPPLDVVEPEVPDQSLVELEASVAQTFSPPPQPESDSARRAPSPPPLPYIRSRRRFQIGLVLGAAVAAIFLIALMSGGWLGESQPPASVKPVAKVSDTPPKPSASLPAPTISTGNAESDAPAPVQSGKTVASTGVAGPSLSRPEPAAPSPAKAEASLPAVVENAADSIVEPPLLKLEDLIESVERSIVVVETRNGLGSGFVLDALGTIVTNYHVMEGANSAQVRFRDGASTSVAGYLVFDSARDLALLHVDLPAARLHPLPIAKGVPKKGQRAFAFGAPKGLDWSVAEGIVSGLRTGNELNQLIQKNKYAPAMNWIQTTAAISPGNSGGPLIDAQGSVMAVNTMILFPGSSQNLNFAVSAGEIAGIYDSKNRQVRPLPQNAAPAGRPTTPPATAWTVKLPGDKSIASSVGELNVRATWDRVFVRRSPVALVQEDDYQLAAECEPASKKLDGLLTVVYPTGRPKLHASYEDNKREGTLVRWNENGHVLYYERNRNDKVYEVCCLFKDNLPWLVEEYDRFNRVAIHRIVDSQIAATYYDEQEAVGDQSTQDALAALKVLRSQLEQEEIVVRRHVRDYIDGVRRQLAAQNSSLGREAILSAMQQRNAANQALMHSYTSGARRAFLP